MCSPVLAQLGLLGIVIREQNQDKETSLEVLPASNWCKAYMQLVIAIRQIQPWYSNPWPACTSAHSSQLDAYIGSIAEKVQLTYHITV